MVVVFLRDIHIVRAVVELSEDSWLVEVIFVGARGRHWELTTFYWSAEQMCEKTTKRV
jgi:hypothetical protein